jgi:hypothetical protein
VAARNPASAKIAEAIQKEMTAREMTRADVLKRVEAQTGTRPGRQWASRTFSGGSHFTVQVPSEIPNELLTLIAHAIEPDPDVADVLAGRLGKLATSED